MQTQGSRLGVYNCMQAFETSERLQLPEGLPLTYWRRNGNPASGLPLTTFVTHFRSLVVLHGPGSKWTARRLINDPGCLRRPEVRAPVFHESGCGYAAHFRQWAGDGGCLSAIILVQGAIRFVGTETAGYFDMHKRNSHRLADLPIVHDAEV